METITVVFSPEFQEWFLDLTEAQQKSVLYSLEVLRLGGPGLGRPHVDTLAGTAYKNLKELRVQHAGRPLRIAFAFDPKRQAAILCGGDKTGDKRFYEKFIREAEAIYARHLAALAEESA